MVLLAAAFAFPTFAAADPPEEEAVETPAPSPWGLWSRWTPERLEAAEPLPLVTLPGPEQDAEPEPEATTDKDGDGGGSTAAVRYAATGQTAASGGIEVGASESAVFPSSANGKIFGSYYSVVNKQVQRQDYVCSGAVVNSPKGNVIVTAGHCVIDPETGTITSTELIFVPGYRNRAAPFGMWKIQSFKTPETWKTTAKAGVRPNEGGDLAFIELQPNSEGESVEEAVGSFDVAFDQACSQTYTQFGYPAEAPYEGNLLYSNTAAYAGADTTGGFLPVPLKIASDFTRGASGGSWVVGIGTAEPTVLSVTAYGYENQPGYLFGPYFGEAAKKAYGLLTKQSLPAGIEETCAPLPVPPTPPTPPIATPSPTPQPTTPVTVPPPAPVTLSVTRVRSLANGSAVLTAKVSAAGVLTLSGAAVRAESLATPAPGQYRMVVAAKGAKVRLLRQVGKAQVGVKVAFSAAGKTKRVSKKIALSRRTVAAASQRRPSRSR